MTEMIRLYFLYAVIAVFLVIAAVWDIKGGTIPGHLFPCLFGLFVPLVILSDGFYWLSSVIGLLIGMLCFYIMARFFDGGGGDILMMSVLGWCLGARRLVYIILLASGVYLLFSLGVMVVYLIQKKKVREALTNQYPYAPFVLIGYVICYFAGWLV